MRAVSAPSGPDEFNARKGVRRPGEEASPAAGYSSSFSPAGDDPTPSASEALAGNARPPQVLAAVIFGFVLATLLLLGAFAYVVTLSGPLVVFGIVFFALTVAATVGAVRAMHGNSRRYLLIAGAVAGVLGALGVTAGLASGGVNLYWSLVLLLGASVVVLLLLPSSTNYFRTGGRTRR